MVVSRNQLRLATMLNLTLSKSPRLLQPHPNSPSVKKTWHLEYVFIVGNMGTSCLLPQSGVLSVRRKAPVRLVSTLSSQVTQGQVSSTVVQKPQEVDPRFKGHCSLVALVRPDQSRHIVRALRDCLTVTRVPAVCY